MTTKERTTMTLVLDPTQQVLLIEALEVQIEAFESDLKEEHTDQEVEDLNASIEQHSDLIDKINKISGV